VTTLRLANGMANPSVRRMSVVCLSVVCDVRVATAVAAYSGGVNVSGDRGSDCTVLTATGLVNGDWRRADFDPLQNRNP